MLRSLHHTTARADLELYNHHAQLGNVGGITQTIQEHAIESTAYRTIYGILRIEDAVSRSEFPFVASLTPVGGI